MTRDSVCVGYPYVYDLYYRVRHACLKNRVYTLDFVDWIKAGVAYNTLGSKDMSRQAAYFGKLYNGLLRSTATLGKVETQRAVICFYEDLFQLYQDHLVAQLQIASKAAGGDPLSPSEFVLIPTFEQLPCLAEILPVETVSFMQYECKYPEELQQQAATVYLSEGSLLYQGMALMFDYGIKREGNGILLEVR